MRNFNIEKKAIEGPTPVSALIHAATLVTAGVYLILRCAPILQYGSTALIFIAWIGALTAFFAATTGLIQNDLKRVIAFSTCSQLGYIFLALGLSNFSAALFHLVTHAFFKAGLFLAAGAIIHGIADQQDLRRLGGLVSFIPFTYVVVLVCSLSLIALPYMTGFYSKDKILELVNGKFILTGFFTYFLGTISAGITAFYSTRLIIITFFTEPNNLKNNYLNVHEATYLILIPILILSLIAIFFGYVASDLYLGPGTDYLSSVFHNLNKNNIYFDSEFNLSLIYKLLPLIITILGTLISIWTFNNNGIYIYFSNIISKYDLIKNLYSMSNSKWYFDTIQNNLLVNKFLMIGKNISKSIDRGIIEKIGPYGLTFIINNTSKKLISLDNGIVTTYSVYISIGILFSIMFITFSALNSKLGIIFFIFIMII